MVAKKKVETRKSLGKILKSSKSVVVFDLEGIPSKQLHRIRNELKSRGVFSNIAKKRVLERAAEDAGISLSFEGLRQPAIIYSDKPVFEVAGELRKLKIMRKAKAGENSPMDITLPAGPTPAQAGPAISIFKSFAITTMIKDGKISIKDPKTVCRAGEPVSLNLVSLLNMLGIEPVEMSISPESGYCDGLFYTKDVFCIDKGFLEVQILQAAGNLSRLTYGLGYPTKQNAPLLLAKAFGNAKSLGIKTGVPSKDTLPDILRIARAGAMKLEK
ncbi:MAG: 50S ribosomal protein L10 [Candidatus Aenigmatarchaeota archaeon]